MAGDDDAHRCHLASKHTLKCRPIDNARTFTSQYSITQRRLGQLVCVDTHTHTTQSWPTGNPRRARRTRVAYYNVNNSNRTHVVFVRSARVRRPTDGGAQPYKSDINSPRRFIHTRSRSWRALIEYTIRMRDVPTDGDGGPLNVRQLITRSRSAIVIRLKGAYAPYLLIPNDMFASECCVLAPFGYYTWR